MKDPLVEEVRKYRMEHTCKFRGDLSAICSDFRDIQAASGHRVVRRPPRKPEGTRRLLFTVRAGAAYSLVHKGNYLDFVTDKAGPLSGS